MVFFQRKLSEKKSTDENPSKNKPTAEKGQQVLEPNHTHYLLVDDGLCHGYDIGDFRTRFARAVSSYQNLDGNSFNLAVLSVAEMYRSSTHRDHCCRRRSRYTFRDLQ